MERLRLRKCSTSRSRRCRRNGRRRRRGWCSVGRWRDGGNGAGLMFPGGGGANVGFGSSPRPLSRMENRPRPNRANLRRMICERSYDLLVVYCVRGAQRI